MMKVMKEYGDYDEAAAQLLFSLHHLLQVHHHRHEYNTTIFMIY